MQPRLLNAPELSTEEKLIQRVEELEDSLADLEAIRKGLRPLYEALRPLFESAPRTGAKNSGAYQVWKDKLGGGMAQTIDLLLEHGELTKVQIGTFLGLSRESVRIYTNKLIANQLVERNGEKLRLREI